MNNNFDNCIIKVECMTDVYMLLSFLDSNGLTWYDGVKLCSKDRVLIVPNIYYIENNKLYNNGDVDELYKRGFMIYNTPNLFIEEHNDTQSHPVYLSLEEAKRLYDNDEFNSLSKKFYSEVKLNPDKYPTSWEDFCNKVDINIGESYITEDCVVDKVITPHKRDINSDKNLYPNEVLARASLIFAQLIQLRDKYRDGWIPELSAGPIYDIKFKYYKASKSKSYSSNNVFSFPSKEVRDFFFENFEDMLNELVVFVK